MKFTTRLFAVALCFTAGVAKAQTPPTTTQTPPAGQGQGQRPPQTPEQQAAAAARREAEQNAPRPIEGIDSVWTEELTWMEVRDAIKAGKTTALILTGGVDHDYEVATRVRRNLDRIEGAFRGALAQAKARAEISNDTDIAAAARFFVTAIQGLRLIGKTTSDKKVLQDIAKQIVGALKYDR